MSEKKLTIAVPSDYGDPFIDVEETIWLEKSGLISEAQSAAILILILQRVSVLPGGTKTAKKLIGHILSNCFFLSSLDLVGRLSGSPEDIKVKFDFLILNVSIAQIDKNRENLKDVVNRHIKSICHDFYDDSIGLRKRLDIANEKLCRLIFDDDVVDSNAKLEERAAVLCIVRRNKRFPLFDKEIAKEIGNNFDAFGKLFEGLFDCFVAFKGRENISENTQLSDFGIECLSEIFATLDGRDKKTNYLDLLTEKLPERLKKLEIKLGLPEKLLKKQAKDVAFLKIVRLFPFLPCGG